MCHEISSAHWRDGPALGWALAALQAIPSGDDGVPDADTRAALLRTLTSLPDVAAGKGLQLGLLSQFREALTDFARVCRRMLRADDFYVEAYDWVKA